MGDGELNKELIAWYQKKYIQPNCYRVMDDPKILRKSGIYGTLEKKRGSHPMEPIRKMDKVRIWNGTPGQRFFGKKKVKSKGGFKKF